MTKKIIKSLMLFFVTINSTVLPVGEIKIIGLGGDIQKINLGDELISYDAETWMPYVEKIFPWNLAIKTNPSTNPEENPIKAYRGSFATYSKNLINYFIGVQSLNSCFSDEDIFVKIITQNNEGKTHTNEYFLSSQTNYKFNLIFENENLQMTPFVCGEVLMDQFN